VFHLIVYFFILTFSFFVSHFLSKDFDAAQKQALRPLITMLFTFALFFRVVSSVSSIASFRPSFHLSVRPTLQSFRLFDLISRLADGQIGAPSSQSSHSSDLIVRTFFRGLKYVLANGKYTNTLTTRINYFCLSFCFCTFWYLKMYLANNDSVWL
jgi:hypothetical protein